VNEIHVRSPHQNALPIILTHGWPGSVVEFMEVIGPLSDPTRYGGRAEDAFHVVVPSLPGYGFSDKPVETGWDVNRIARAWATLMHLDKGGHFAAFEQPKLFTEELRKAFRSRRA